MKKYRLDMPLLLKESTAEQLGLENRFYQVGESIELPDHIAKRLLEKGGLTEIIPPAPVAATKPKRRKTVKTNEVKNDGTINDNS